MSVNRIPVNELGSPSFVALIAERLAVDPSAAGSGPAPESATAAFEGAEARARRYALDLRTDEGRALLAWGLWLRGAIVGAALVAIALVQLATAAVHPVYALMLGVAGGFAATYCWRRVNAADGDPDGKAPAALPSAGKPDALAAR
jgi:hypothetical protein